MQDKPPQRVLDYGKPATSSPRDIGAVLGLVVLLLVLYGALAIVFGIVIAFVTADSRARMGRADPVDLLVATATCASGIAAIWGAARITRTRR